MAVDGGMGGGSVLVDAPVNVKVVSGAVATPSGIELSNSTAPPVPVINNRSEAALAVPTCTVNAAKRLRMQKRTNSRARIASSFGCVSTRQLRAQLGELIDL
jgi:hypothetical protein